MFSLFSIFATPFLTGAINFGSWYLGQIWEGLKDIFDNLSTILCVATLIAIGTIYGASAVNCKNLAGGEGTGKPIISWNPFTNDGS